MDLSRVNVDWNVVVGVEQVETNINAHRYSSKLNGHFFSLNGQNQPLKPNFSCLIFS